MAGLVSGYSKPGAQVDEAVVLDVTRAAAVRLPRRREARPRPRRVGPRRRRASTASTSAHRPAGSRTACSSAAPRRVIALDVGYGQLHPRLRDDPRVTVLERVNARALDELPFAPQLMTCDVSFIGVAKALPAALAARAPGLAGARAREAPVRSRTAVKPRRGVVRDPAVQQRVLREVAVDAVGWNAAVGGRRRLGIARAEGKPGVLPLTSSSARVRRCPMSSTPGSKTPSAEAVRRATVIAPGKRPAIGDALERLERVAGETGVELVDATCRRRGATSSRSSSAATARCSGAQALPGHRGSGDRGQLRHGRLPHVDPGRGAGGRRWRARSPARTRSSSFGRSRSTHRRSATSRSTTSCCGAASSDA